MRLNRKSLGAATRKLDAKPVLMVGAALFIVGGGMHLAAIVTTSGYEGDFFKFVLPGLFLFLGGFGLWLGERRTMDPLVNASTDFKALLRAMVGAAEFNRKADPEKFEVGETLDEVDADEVDLIILIIRQNIRRGYTQAAIEDACLSVMGEEESLRMHLFDWHAELPIEFRKVIVQAAALVIELKGDINPACREFLIHVSRALLLPDDTFAETVAKRHELLAR